MTSKYCPQIRRGGFVALSISLVLLVADLAWVEQAFAQVVPTQTAPSTTSDGDSKSAVESPAAPDSPAAAKFESKVATAAAPVQVRPHAAWEAALEEIDKQFAKYLVTPMATVLFYDFGTKERLGGSIPFIVAWLFCGAVFCTLRFNFVNIRAFWLAIRITRGEFDEHQDRGEVSHFQALSSALSATVGLGNIAGVAIAVSVGGPGAVLWMILAGILGMSSKFTECSLGLMYRKIDRRGVVSGGPMHYLKDGLAELGLGRFGTFLAIVFAVMCMGASFGGGCAFQVSQSMRAVQQDIPFFAEEGQVNYGLLMAVLVGVVIIGGIRRIAATAEKVVPLMCGLHMLVCAYILIVNYDQILPAVQTIVRSAFTSEAGLGGVIGTIMMGIRRAAFSNEAGVGSASIAHSAAKTNEPISEGLVALLEPFIDTVIVCTCTGLVMVITGVASKPEFKHFVDESNGAGLTREAFATAGWFLPYILSATVFLFAYSTMISWSYYGERCWTYLFGHQTSIIYKLMFLVFVVLGSIVTAPNILDFADLMILAMALPNIVGMVLLSGKVKTALAEYLTKIRRNEIKTVEG